MAFEGIDGAGKTRQMDAVAARLAARGYALRRLREPTDGSEGREIRRRAADGPPLAPREEVALFVADRRRNVAESIGPALAAGAVVLQDRSFYSTVAYQGARGIAGLGAPELLALHDFVPRPDAVFLFDLPVAVAMERLRGRGRPDAFEREGFLEAVRALYLEMAAPGAPLAGGAPFVVVDATPAPDEVTRALLDGFAGALGIDLR